MLYYTGVARSHSVVQSLAFVCQTKLNNNGNKLKALLLTGSSMLMKNNDDCVLLLWALSCYRSWCCLVLMLFLLDKSADFSNGSTIIKCCKQNSFILDDNIPPKQSYSCFINQQTLVKMFLLTVLR